MEQVELIAGSKSKAVKIAEDPDNITLIHHDENYTEHTPVQNILYDFCMTRFSSMLRMAKTHAMDFRTTRVQRKRCELYL